MAKMIISTCGWCGDIELPAAAATLDIPVRAGDDASIRFTCPQCARDVVQQVPQRAVMLLLRAGVEVVVAAPESRLRHAASTSLTQNTAGRQQFSRGCAGLARAAVTQRLCDGHPSAAPDVSY